MQQMASPQASVHMKGLERVLLQVYSKSGKGNMLDPMAYSDKEKNTPAIASPSLTIIGESVPERFYEVLDEAMIASGLLPRFMCFEYKGKREYLKEGTEVKAVFYGEAIFSIELPQFLELMVVKTDSIESNSHVSNANKLAILETGAKVEVPMFVESGDIVKVDTQTGEYIQRV